MTTLQSPPSSSTKPAQGFSQQRASTRIGIIALMIISVVVAGVLRGVAMDYQTKSSEFSGGGGSRSTLGNMDSYALALLLGGLRGPLVMFLWTTSENEKGNHDLKDLDTKIEWIRLLQPEFDSVHIFQIWNKAYNISVLMASPANKYVTIMDAIKYAQKVDQEKPGDLNILNQEGSVYRGKLAATNLPEAPFYIRQFREETLTDANRKLAFPSDAREFHRLGLPAPLLDENNDLLAHVIAPRRAKPAGEIPGGQWNDGSDLQYLAKYKHFPTGIPPQAMAYNYNKRAQVAQTSEGQEPLQLSPMVIDSEPAVSLKEWADEQSREARDYESRAFGLAADSPDGNKASAMLKPDQSVTDTRALNFALYDYDLSARLAADAEGEYHRHLSNPLYANRINVYQSHLADLNSLSHMAVADHDFLAASQATGSQKKELLTNALANYQKALIQMERTILEFYTEMPVFTDPSFPPQITDMIRLRQIPDDRVDAAFALSLQLIDKHKLGEYNDDRVQYIGSLNRCRARIKTLQEYLK